MPKRGVLCLSGFENTAGGCDGQMVLVIILKVYPKKGTGSINHIRPDFQSGRTNGLYETGPFRLMKAGVWWIEMPPMTVRSVTRTLSASLLRVLLLKFIQIG
jgi:hypothetical protein